MADIKEKVSRLAETGVFRSVPEEQLTEIASVLREKRVPAHTHLTRKGEPGDSFYIVHSGKLRVYLRGEDGVETNLNWLGPGDNFGEMALLTDEPRSTNIETLEESHLFVLTKEEFDGVLRKNPDIYKNCIRFISNLVKKDDRRLLEETEKEYKTTRLSISDFIFIGLVILIFATVFNLSNPNRINVLPRFYDPDPASPWPPAEDPLLVNMNTLLTAALNSHVRERLGFETDIPYKVLNKDVHKKWNWRSGLDGGQGFAGVAGNLKSSISLNRYLKVFIAHGVFDLVTPYFGSIIVTRQMSLDPAVYSNLRLKVYDGGHMFYTHRQGRLDFFEDARIFFKEAGAEKTVK